MSDVTLGGVEAGWITIENPGGPPLRSWWARPAKGPLRAGILVLPEVFGVNAWVRSVAERLAAAGYGSLAVPLFARTAPELELAYDDGSLREGRSHKERTTTDQLLGDLTTAIAWLGRGSDPPARRVGCVGFCFGGHVALLAATLPQVAATCDFYGAGVATGRPGGGPPSLDVVPAIQGTLLCVCGREDPLIPPGDREAIARSLEAANRRRTGQPPHVLHILQGGHGFMCEDRSDHRPDAAAEGWRLMLDFFGRMLPT
jgi:carboxymethylenebutenolidase